MAADVRTRVVISDGASSALKAMYNSLNIVISSFERMQSSCADAVDVEGIQNARNELARAGMELDRITDGFNDSNNSAQRLNKTLSNTTSTIMKLVGSYLSIKSTGAIIGISDELTQTNARLSLMTDEGQETQELFDMVYQSAQNARGSVSDMAAIVARLGNNVGIGDGKVFGSSSEVVAFGELLQKQFAIAGASTSEAQAAMIQLSQGLASGVLRGEELNSVFEQAPTIVQSIADYLDVDIGQIRSLASEGQLTADVVKNAMFAASEEINEKFESMPMTWGQVWQSFQNTALMAFQPVLNKINEIANNDKFQGMVTKVTNSMYSLSSAAMHVLDFLIGIADIVASNWSIISPIIMGVVGAIIAYNYAMLVYNTVTGIAAVASGIMAAAQAMQAGVTFAATAAQYGFNSALLACPITWIVILIIAAIAAIAAFASWIAQTTGIASSGFGVIAGAINVVIQFVKNLGLTAANIFLGIINAVTAVGNNIYAAFYNAIQGAISFFYDLLSAALTVISKIASALNQLPFVEFDVSGLESAAGSYAKKSANAANNKLEYQNIGDAFNSGMNTFDAFQDGWISDAFSAGANWGDNFASSWDFGSGDFGGAGDYFDFQSAITDGIDGSGMAQDGADTAGSAGSIADSLDEGDEILEYLRDIAERDAINRFTTAQIKIDMNNSNTINNTNDIDSIMNALEDKLYESMNIAAERAS